VTFCGFAICGPNFVCGHKASTNPQTQNVLVCTKYKNSADKAAAEDWVIFPKRAMIDAEPCKREA
jgi:hypothetical protein